MPDLALHGGTPVRDRPFPSGPHIDATERAAVAEVLESGVLSGFIGAPGPHFLGGPMVQRLESEWCSLGSFRHAVAVNSATAGLHAGVEGLGLPPGSEIVVPPLTMSATVAAIRMAGHEVRFADVDRDIFTLTADSVRHVLSPRTAAVLVVHLFGQMAPLGDLIELAAERQLTILEDAAQAPGATQNSLWPGSLTSGAVFSFNQHKTITSGEGGILCTNDSTVAHHAQLIRNHGESAVGAFPDMDPLGLIGWNYRPTELDAAVALAQTKKLEMLTAYRVALAEELSRSLDGLPGLTPPVVLPGNRHVYFTYPIRFSPQVWGLDRGSLVAGLQAEGIPCANGYVAPLYRLPLFGTVGEAFDPADYPIAESLHTAELLLLPVCRYPVTSNDLRDVVTALEKCWELRHKLQVVDSTTS